MLANLVPSTRTLRNPARLHVLPAVPILLPNLVLLNVRAKLLTVASISAMVLVVVKLVTNLLVLLLLLKRALKWVISHHFLPVYVLSRMS
jgi:hypothetical protein